MVSLYCRYFVRFSEMRSRRRSRNSSTKNAAMVWRARGEVNMRRVWASRPAAVSSAPDWAASSRASSGGAPHRKYDSRDASSKLLSRRRPGCVGSGSPISLR